MKVRINLKALLSLFCLLFLCVSCASSCKKEGAPLSEIRGYIESRSRDSFPRYFLTAEDGSLYELKYDKEAGMSADVAESYTGYAVLVSGLVSGKSILVQKIEMQ